MKGWWLVFGIIPVLETLNLSIKDTIQCPDFCLCLNVTTSCQNNDLDQLPNDIDPQVISLDLSINRFEKVPENLKTFMNLKYLNLSYNRISTLGHLDFNRLLNLEILDLSFNLFHDWKDIHSQTFRFLFNLTFIDFSHNTISNLPQHSKHFQLKSLIILKLNNCSMTKLPLEFLNGMTSIRELHINMNPLQNLSVTLSSKSLKFMDLSESLLYYIAPNAFKGLKVLETLHLNKNKYLRSITINSYSLLYLDISECFLERSPVGSIKSLTTLNLHGNIIRDLTNNIFINMTNLIYLNISLNAITFIEMDAFSGLTNLKSIDLSLNKISKIEDSTFFSTKSLLSLDISHNYLTSIDGISSMSIKELDVSYCEIKSVGKYTLSNLPKLTSLSLQRNFISFIPDEWIGDTLQTLDLSDCRIKNIYNKTFTYMPYLKELDLSNNRLTTIQSSSFPQSLTLIKLKDNQWRCDCPVLKDTFEWLKKRGSFLNDLVCDSPETVDGLTWESACQDQWYPSSDKKDHLWWYSIALLISMFFLLTTVIALRKLNDIRERRFREIDERRREQEREARETLQRMQQINREYREEANRNAPDPRDSQGPPSYNDALLLPRLDSSHPSLAGSVHSLGGSNSEINKKGKVRRKRRRRKSNERVQSRSVEDINESEPERSQRPLESDF